jgi:hypothetical protein
MNYSASDFVRRDLLAASTSVPKLRAKLVAAEKRVWDAELIGWDLLAKSWQLDVEAIKARLDELGAGHERRRRRVAVAPAGTVEEAVCE